MHKLLSMGGEPNKRVARSRGSWPKICYLSTQTHPCKKIAAGFVPGTERVAGGLRRPNGKVEIVKIKK